MRKHDVMQQNLRTRLLTLMLLGIASITLLSLLGSGWGLLRVRNRAISDSEQALEDQTKTYLLELAQSRAALTNQVLQSAQEIALTLAQSVTEPPPLSEQKAVAPLVIAPDGRRYQQGNTTVILPRSPEISALNEIILTNHLEQSFPSVANISLDILRVSYLTADGMLRTFPPVQAENVPADWTIATDPGFMAGQPSANPDRRLVWTDVHRIFGSSEQVISAAQPVYRDNNFIGVIVVDLSITRLTASLAQIQVGKNGFPVVLNQNGSLIAATEIGQQVLLGQLIESQEQRRTIQLETVNPEMALLLQGLKSNAQGIMLVNLNDQRYLMATAPIAGIKWNLVLAYPSDEISATTQRTTERIRSIAQQTQIINLMIMGVLTLIIGLTLRYLLRRQLVKPLAALIQATESVAGGNLQTIIMPYNDEIGQLAHSFNTMTLALRESRADILANNERLEQAVQARTTELEQAMQQTAVALTTQQELVQTLNRVSSPLIPVIPGVLAMPLIGQLTEERTMFAMQELLRRIEISRVRLVLLDLTGVPVLEPTAAHALRQTVVASRLLGARTMLVGITPEVAQTLVTLGLDMHGIDTAADLQSAIAQVLRSQKTL